CDTAKNKYRRTHRVAPLLSQDETGYPMMREGSPLRVGGTGDLWNTERQQMSLCKAAFLGSETLLRSCISLGYPCYTASAVPRKGWVRSAQGKDGMRHTALQARGNGLDLPYRHWLTGYLTAVHQLTKAMVNMRGTTHIDGMLWLLEQYCIKHRQRSSVTPWNPW